MLSKLITIHVLISYIFTTGCSPETGVYWQPSWFGAKFVTELFLCQCCRLFKTGHWTISHQYTLETGGNKHFMYDRIPSGLNNMFYNVLTCDCNH